MASKNRRRESRDYLARKLQTERKTRAREVHFNSGNPDWSVKAQDEIVYHQYLRSYSYYNIPAQLMDVIRQCLGFEKRQNVDEARTDIPNGERFSGHNTRQNDGVSWLEISTSLTLTIVDRRLS